MCGTRQVQWADNGRVVLRGWGEMEWKGGVGRGKCVRIGRRDVWRYFSNEVVWARCEVMGAKEVARLNCKVGGRGIEKRCREG